ncbi:MAG: cytochrome c oxidase subunit II [Deltaproteobacteria bacterium]|nr:cytochrome c oxidase subunit II [Deltaproteobacteria bacterium]
MKPQRTFASIAALLLALFVGSSALAQPGPDGSGSAVGSGSAAGSGAGSAEAPLPADGSAGSAAAPVAKPPTKVTEVACDKVVPKYTVTSSDATTTYAVALAQPDETREADLKPYDIEVNDVVKFVMSARHDAVPDPTASDINLRAPAGKATCLQFTGEGEFGFHSTSTNLHGKIVAKPWFTRRAELPVREGGNFWMPKAVNSAADTSDMMFIAVLALSIFFFSGITIAVVYFVIKYRHRPGHKAQPSAGHNDALEITWSIIPTIISVFLFWYGWKSYTHVVTPPTSAVEIGVTAQRWTWEFKHSNGAKDVDLHVPVNTPVRLVMTSTDVLHAFYAPVLRVKQDIIPRRYTYVWFNATKPGTYRLNCAEYCGTNHSQMGMNAAGRRAVVVVHTPGGYERYLADKDALEKNMAPDALGKLMYEKKGCVACHSTDGSARTGPSFKGSFGTMVNLAGGATVKMDENYIRESLMAPQAKARPGYPASMPSFETNLKEAEIQGIIAFIQSLK